MSMFYIGLYDFYSDGQLVAESQAREECVREHAASSLIQERDTPEKFAVGILTVGILNPDRPIFFIKGFFFFSCVFHKNRK